MLQVPSLLKTKVEPVSVLQDPTGFCREQATSNNKIKSDALIELTVFVFIDVNNA